MAWSVNYLGGIHTFTVSSNTITLGSDTNATASSVPAGALILVGVVDNTYGASSSAGGVADSNGNSYSLVGSVFNATGSVVTALYACVNSALLSSSAAINYNDAAFSNDDIGMFAVSATGNAASASPDVTNSGSGSSKTASSGSSGAASVINELFFGIAGTNSLLSSFSSLGGGWTNIDSSGELFGWGMAGAYLVNSGTTAQTFTAVLSSSSPWGAIVASFSPSASSGSASGFNMAMMGL